METETIVVLTAGSTIDPYSGVASEDWTTPTERSVTTLAPVNPTHSNEPVQDARNSATTGLTIYLPVGDPITRFNRVRVWGEVFEVVGMPKPWSRAGVEVQLTLTSG